MDNIKQRLAPQAVKIRSGSSLLEYAIKLLSFHKPLLILLIMLSRGLLIPLFMEWHVFYYFHHSLMTVMFCLVFTDIQVSCYAYEGVDAVKNALRAGLNLSTEEMPIKVSHLSSQ